MTAKALGIPVIAGPIEGTAIGNLIVQMIADGVFENLSAARSSIGKSFEIRTFEP
jgi:rhamnulokinase